jgi:hypothetical protein
VGGTRYDVLATQSYCLQHSYEVIAEVLVIIAEVEVGIAEGLWKRDFGEMLA